MYTVKKSIYASFFITMFFSKKVHFIKCSFKLCWQSSQGENQLWLAPAALLQIEQYQKNITKDFLFVTRVRRFKPAGMVRWIICPSTSEIELTSLVDCFCEFQQNIAFYLQLVFVKIIYMLLIQLGHRLIGLICTSDFNNTNIQTAQSKTLKREKILLKSKMLSREKNK